MEREIGLLVKEIEKRSSLQKKNIQKYVEAMDGSERAKLIRRISYFLEHQKVI